MNYGYCRKHKKENLYANWCKDHKHISSKLVNGTFKSCRNCQFWQTKGGKQ